MYSPLTLALFALPLTVTLVEAAGPHAGRLATHRRHHARAAAAASTSAVQRSTDVGERDDDSCTLGAWKCYGTELHRCYNDQWNFVENCTGTDIVCSDALYTTGCVWSWDVESASSDSASGTATATSTASTVDATTVATSVITNLTNSTTTVTSAINATTTITTDDNEIDDDSSESSDECEDEEEDSDDDDEDCEDDESDDESSVILATATSTTYAAASVITATLTTDYATASVTESASVVPDLTSAVTDSISAVTDVATAVTDSVTAVTESATATAAVTSTTAIGGQLYANGGSDDDDDDSYSIYTSEEASLKAHATSGSSSTSAQTAYATQTSSSDWNNGNSLTASVTASLTDEYGLTASVNATSTGGKHRSTSASRTSSNDSYLGSTASVSATLDNTTQTATDSSTSTATSGGHHRHTTVTASAALAANSTIAASGRLDTSGIVTATTSAKTYAPTVTSSSNTTSTNSSSTTTWSAPHWVIYADEWLTSMPSVSDLSSFNRFILAFWMSSGTGAVDDAEAWAEFDASTRASVLEEYHDAGIALMVSAFGSTDAPTSNGADAKETAQDLAAWVKKYDLDGVDIDYEDMDAMNSAQAVSWLVEFQTELRSLLPSPYIISHAPVAPWFTSASDYSDGAYVSVDQQVGDGIDWYNIQFYNQGSDQYTTCETLITNSGTDWPSTSVLEINSYAGLALNKIVIGKPLDSGAADNGYMDAATINQCVEIAKESGWDAGVMFWEWTSEAPSIMSSVRGGN